MRIGKSWRGPVRTVAAAAGLAAVGGGLLVADTLTRPLDVRVRTKIDLYQRDGAGDWKKVDGISPSDRRFQATLLEMARSKKVGTDFVFRTKTREGRTYSARLVDAADVNLDPTTGKFEADLTFEIGLDGKSARVDAHLTSESRAGPAGTLRGRRARGVLGRSPTTVTLVSANELRLPGEAPILLVCEEEYRLIPGRGR